MPLRFSHVMFKKQELKKRLKIEQIKAEPLNTKVLHGTG